MVTWAIAIEISGSRMDAEGLLRLEKILSRDVPDFEADCALWSGWLGVHGTVRAPTPTEALEWALKNIDAAFDEAGIDMSRASEIVNVTMRRVLRPRPVSSPQSVADTLLRRVSPAHHRSRSDQT